MGAGKLAPSIILKKIKKKLDKYWFYFVYSMLNRKEII